MALPRERSNSTAMVSSPTDIAPRTVVLDLGELLDDERVVDRQATDLAQRDGALLDLALLDELRRQRE